LGNVITATDANGTVITNAYDKANRVVTKSYAPGQGISATPSVEYFYDGKCSAVQSAACPAVQSPNYAKGKLTQVKSSVSETRYTQFDYLGRLLQMEQRTPVTGETIATAIPRVSSYQYNFAGALVQETYPSGRVVKNEFEADGDLMRIYGQANANSPERTYANGFSYTADGKIQRLRLGNGRWESAKFNERLQVTELALGTSDGNGSLWKLGYEYGELASNGTVDTAKNTGNIARQTVSFTGLTNPLVQTYKYDSLYRLTEAKEVSGANQTWKEAFNYDRYGNRIGHDKFVGTTQLTLDNKTHPTIDANTNRFNTGQGYVYDKNGNLTDDAEGRTFIFNGDNKQRYVVQSGKNIGEYFYDGEGKRVKKKIYELDGINVKEETVFVYSAGKLVAEYSTKPPPPNPTTSYTATDQLGSPRVITDSNGQVISRRDFMPFGEEIVNNIGERAAASLKYNVADSVRQKFTGYEKDEETQLDFAEARMYENRHGRFTAVDPLLASGKSANPQSFNRFVYVSNNPIISTDPSGQCEAGKCPSFYRGAVYTNGTNYDNEFHEGWQVFRGRPTTFTADDGTRYGITGNGWTQLGAYRAASEAFSGNDTIRQLTGNFPESPFLEAASGFGRGLVNTPIDAANFVTLAAINNGRLMPTLDNPLAIPRLGCNTAIQCNFSTGTTMAAPFAFGVAAAPFRAASSLSVVPRSSLLTGFGSDEAIIENVNNLVPKKGWYDAVIHGTRDGQNFSISGQTIPPEKFYQMILQDGYQPGTNIRLMSCWSGSCSNGAAQQLSNLAGAKVVAPSGAVETVGPTNIYYQGKRFFIFGAEKNEFRLFKPGQ
jgi:RHS repeat-associated protein